MNKPTKTGSKTTHTPGPWSVTGEKDKRTGDRIIADKNWKYVAMAMDFNSFEKDDEVEANARLIAAAPDLYNACRWAHDSLIRTLGDCGLTGKEIDGHATVVAIRAAISKAEGR